jgi:hypothetical protein
MLSERIGIPRVLAALEDVLFEALRDTERLKNWPLRFGEAIRPGANLSKVWPQFMLWWLDTHGVENDAEGARIVQQCFVQMLERPGEVPVELRAKLRDLGEARIEEEGRYTLAKLAELVYPDTMITRDDILEVLFEDEDIDAPPESYAVEMTDKLIELIKAC